MKDVDAKLIWEMWEASKEEHEKAYQAGLRDGQSGDSIGEVSDTWGPVGDSYTRGFHDGQTQQIMHVMRKRMREVHDSLQDTGHSSQDIYQKAFDVVRDSMLNKAEQESDYKTKHILQDLNFKDFTK